MTYKLSNKLEEIVSSSKDRDTNLNNEQPLKLKQHSGVDQPGTLKIFVTDLT